MVPVILSVFANDGVIPLKLGEERDALVNIFNDHREVELQVLENASYKFISQRIIGNDLAERITVFHFGGHSNGKNISLINDEMKVDVLIGLLKMFKNLQLVFLNGCDNYDQAKRIQAAGIKAAVITTIKPLNDAIAISFASYFYQAFYLFHSIQAAFDWAQNGIIHEYGLEKNIFIRLDRGVDLEDDAETNRHSENMVSVYVLSSDEKGYLEKKLRKRQNVIQPDITDIEYLPNRYLVESIGYAVKHDSSIADFLNSMVTIDSDNNRDEYKKIKSKYEKFETSYSIYCRNLDNESYGELVTDILALLPSPICFHINLLFMNGVNWSLLQREKRVELLKRQIITYDALLQLLGFMLLSCFWNALIDKQFKISDEHRKVILNFLSASDSNNQGLNYPALMGAIRDIFNNKEIKPFITEYQDLKNIFPDKQGFFKMHLHIQGLKSYITSGEILTMNINSLCRDTENILSTIFLRIGFVIRYKLSTVKSIELTKSRLKGPSYYIKRIILDGSKVAEDDTKNYTKYTDSFSVILARGSDENTFTDFLSLSPFIIDENAIKGENLSKLYFYSHKQGETYVYRWTEDPNTILIVKEATYDKLEGKTMRELKLINMRMVDLKDQLKAFEDLISN